MRSRLNSFSRSSTVRRWFYVLFLTSRLFIKLAQDDRRLVVRAKKLLRSVLIGVTLSVAATAAALTPGVDDRVIVWDTQTVSLDAATHAIDAVPALRPYRDRVIDRCGRHSVNPLVIALLAERSPLLMPPADEADAMQDRLDAFIAGVARVFFMGRSAARAAANVQRSSPSMDAFTAAGDAGDALASGGLRAVAETFMPGDDRAAQFAAAIAARYPASVPSAAQKSGIVTDAAAPANFLRLPWTVGQTGWSFNGVHTTTGGCGTAPCSAPQSSIDFSLGWPVWGTDTSSARVLAAMDGTVSKFSSCNLRVTNSNGWAVNYYHLDAALVNTGDVVYAGQPIAIYATVKTQALCDGGSSTGPHVHFTLLQNGLERALDQTELSGWRVNSALSTADYDSWCSRMNLSRSGITACAYNGASPSAWAMHTLPAAMPSNTRCALDVDGNGTPHAATDGVLLLRYLMGVRGAALIAGALGNGASRNTAGAVESFLSGKSYDLDVDGAARGSTDAVMALRVLLGLTGNSVGTGLATGTGLLTTGTQVAAYVQGCR